MDAYVRQHATNVVHRGLPVEIPPVVEHWQITRIDTWARVDGRWWALAGDPRRWVPADVVRRHWPRERKKRA